MIDGLRPLAERGRVSPQEFADEVFGGGTPVVLREQVAGWPAVRAAAGGAEAAARYIAALDRGAPVQVMIGPPDIAGRFFYRDDLSGFNFGRQQVGVGQLLAELLRLADDPAPHALYAGAAPAGEHLPGWNEANALDLPMPRAQARVWIGNATRVATHYDASPNLACVVAGTRRFLLFPPEQIANLYVGPLDHTMAGQPSSMVDPDASDLARYPRFAEAMRHALVAELAPGDAIFIPALWWHNVAATGPLNVLVNYWSERAEAADPFPALVHALMAVRDLPRHERAAWQHWFDHYVFAEGALDAAAHLPDAAHGVLGAASHARTEKIMGFLRRVLGAG